MNFKAAICPSCGGQLQVPDDRDSVKCLYCGSDIVVREAIQKAFGPDPANFLGLAEIALEKDNYQEALNYCTKALELDFKNPEAWYLKGRCNGSYKREGETLQHQYNEMISDFENSLKFANDNEKELYKSKIATAINEIIVNITDIKLSSCSSSESYDKCKIQAELMEFAIGLSPDNTIMMKNIVEMYNLILVYEEQQYHRMLSYNNRSYWEKTITEIDTEIKQLTEKMKIYIDKIKNFDPTYTTTGFIRKISPVPPPVVKKKHLWQ